MLINDMEMYKTAQHIGKGKKKTENCSSILGWYVNKSTIV